ncbi:unnamed protein product [Sphagnum jensenii]|uniref:Uncharacterized protein n=1 Tax=Sphagnum jensenii TaxID=128206 RepID=A0ABP1AZQ1_9BRYO
MSVNQLQQLARNMRPGENLRQEDVQEQLKSHMAQALDGGKVHAQRVNDPSTGIFGFNFLESWDYISSFPSERVRGSATRGSSGAGGSHVGSTDIPSKGGKDQVVLGSATGGSSGAGASHVGGTDIPSKVGKDQGGDGGEDQVGDGGEDQRGDGGEDQRGDGGEDQGGDGGKDQGGDGGEDQGGDGGEDNDNGKGRGAKRNEIRQINQPNVLVTVIPGSQYGRWKRHSVLDQPEGSDIDPIPEQPEGSSCKDLKRFGWFHDKIKVSFQCMKPLAATPTPSELLGSEKVKNTMSEQTQTSPSQFEAKGKVGCSNLSAAVSWISTSDVRGEEKVREGVSNFIGDTRFRADCVDGGGKTPMIAYNFKLCPEIPKDKLPDSCDEENRKGSVCTVFPHFKADWIVTSVGICEYELNVERHACELVSVTEKKPTYMEWVGKEPEPSCTCKEMLQTYSVRLHINHSMSNIATPAEPGRPLCIDHPSNNLIGINEPPSSPAFDESSSRTQQHTL